MWIWLTGIGFALFVGLLIYIIVKSDRDRTKAEAKLKQMRFEIEEEASKKMVEYSKENGKLKDNLNDLKLQLASAELQHKDELVRVEQKHSAELSKEKNCRLSESLAHKDELNRIERDRAQELNDLIELYENELSKMRLDHSNEVASVKLDNAELDKYDQLIKAKQLAFDGVVASLATKNAELGELEEKLKVGYAANEKSLNELRELDDRRNALSHEIGCLMIEKGKIADIIIKMGDDVADETEKMIEVMRRHKEALVRDANAADENERWEFVANAQELHLIDIIAEVVETYPEIKKELSKVVWEKIWRPKVQDLCKKKGMYDKDGWCGIYKLSVKGDENVAYVGQAVNIKDRWFEHCKKMLGVDSSGDERLYRVVKRPDMVWWEVLELCKKSELNERENYWIEFFGCREVGLNKK